MKYSVIDLFDPLDPQIMLVEEVPAIFYSYREAKDYGKMQAQRPLIVPMSTHLMEDIEEAYKFISAANIELPTGSTNEDIEFKLSEYLDD